MPSGTGCAASGTPRTTSAQDDPDGAWVHAWLHRIEGDLSNADYWYRRANRPPARGDTRDEGLRIARALIGRIGGP